MDIVGDILTKVTAVARDGRAVLLRGPSGAGKSDLALRLIAEGWTLIGDDGVRLQVAAGTAWLAPVPATEGLIEVRGIGVVRVPVADRTALALAVDLVPDEEVPRVPEPALTDIGGIAVPCVRLVPWPVSTTLKIGLAVGGAVVVGMREDPALEAKP